MSNDDHKITPVGVTIAYQRHNRRITPEDTRETDEPIHSFPKTPPRLSSSSSLQQVTSSERRKRRNKSSSLKRKFGKIQKPISSFTVFWEGAALYAACILLPAVVRKAWTTLYWSDILDLSYWCIHSSPNDDLSALADFYESKGWFWSEVLAPFCTSLRRELSMSKQSHILLNHIDTDVWTVVVCALGLAFVRLTVIQLLVMPLQSTRQFEAMVRCKSIHLLSSDYSQTPVGTPTAHRRDILDNSHENVSTLRLPSLTNNNASHPSEHMENDHNLGLGIDESESHVQLPEPILRLDTIQVHNHTADIGEQQEDEDNISDLDEDDDDVIHEFATRLTDAATADTSTRLYAGPRYATAVFRLLYSTAAIALALFYFADADFWPWYVGGKGSTKNCWDLSGGLTVSGLDADFDHHNMVLKRYFLWQASYHWHSGAFHLLSMVLILMYRHQDIDDYTPRFMMMRANSASYFRRLFQHALALGSIAVAYVFSSLRRLAAIGLFAFDVSSWLMHFLQVCINAPPESRLSHIPTHYLHKYVAVPAFCYCRLFIWSTLAWSALNESNKWLQQLERTLWPGAAQHFKKAIFLWVVLLLSTTMVYGHRLLFHKHIQRHHAKRE